MMRDTEFEDFYTAALLIYDFTARVFFFTFEFFCSILMLK